MFVGGYGGGRGGHENDGPLKLHEISTVLRPSTDDQVCELIHGILGDLGNIDYHAGSIVFVGVKGGISLAALIDPNSETINNVPVDQRELSKILLLESLKRPDQRVRVPLLCNAGSAGSGKSVLQAFNLYWFVQNTSGLAFELTFNDDQGGLWKGGNVIAGRDLEEALAVRIIHRLLELYMGTEKCDSFVRAESPLLNSICVLEDPFEAALRIVRRVLGVSKDTKIMLGVDELAKAGPNRPSLLKCLTGKLDKDPKLFLSVSAYGCVDLSTFATDSNRILLLQPLPPIFTVNAWKNQLVLPDVLRVFADKRLRKNLKFRPEDKVVYAQLSRLMLASGGHPRRVEYLLSGLSEFNVEGNKFTSYQLQCFLNSEESTIKFYMNLVVLQELKSIPPSDLELLAKDCANSFLFPVNADSARMHQPFLQGTQVGSCAFIPGSDVDGKGHAYIPMPVLMSFPLCGEDYPCACALFMLYFCLEAYSNIDTPMIRGKTLERVVLYATLLYARANEGIADPSVFCSQFGSGVKPVESPDLPNIHILKPEVVKKIGHWEDVIRFPSATRYPSGVKGSARSAADALARDVHAMVNSLNDNPDWAGGIFAPTDPSNIGGVVFGLFHPRERQTYYTLLVIQCKDWFSDINRGASIMSEWEKSKTAFPVNADGFIEGTNVKPLFLLFTCNPLEEKYTCKYNEGICDILTMRKWLPTAAYACESGYRMRELFSSPPESPPISK